MAPYAVEKQDENIVENLIDQQPVRVNMTFSAAFVIPRKVVVAVLCFKHFAVCQSLHNIKQLIKILALFFASFKSFLNCPVTLILYFIRQALS